MMPTSGVLLVPCRETAIRAHTPRPAGQAYQDGAKVQAEVADRNRPPSRSRSGKRCGCSAKLAREGKVSAEDMREVLSAGASRQEVGDALAVCAAFNTTDRLADVFGFELLTPRGLRGRSQVPAQPRFGYNDRTAAPDDWRHAARRRNRPKPPYHDAAARLTERSSSIFSLARQEQTRPRGCCPGRLTLSLQRALRRRGPSYLR